MFKCCTRKEPSYINLLEDGLVIETAPNPRFSTTPFRGVSVEDYSPKRKGWCDCFSFARAAPPAAEAYCSLNSEGPLANQSPRASLSIQNRQMGEMPLQKKSSGQAFWSYIVEHCRHAYSPSSHWQVTLAAGFARDAAWYGVSVSEINVLFRPTKAFYGLEGQLVAQWLFATVAILAFALPISLCFGKKFRSTLPILASISGSIPAWSVAQNVSQSYFEGLGYNKTQSGDLSALLTGPSEGAAQLAIYALVFSFIQSICAEAPSEKPPSQVNVQAIYPPLAPTSGESICGTLQRACLDLTRALLLLIFVGGIASAPPGSVWQLLNLHLSESEEIPAYCSALLLALGVSGTTAIILPFISMLTAKINKCTQAYTPRISRRSPINGTSIGPHNTYFPPGESQASWWLT